MELPEHWNRSPRPTVGAEMNMTTTLPIILDSFNLAIRGGAFGSTNWPRPSGPASAVEQAGPTGARAPTDDLRARRIAAAGVASEDRLPARRQSPLIGFSPCSWFVAMVLACGSETAIDSASTGDPDTGDPGTGAPTETDAAPTTGATDGGEPLPPFCDDLLAGPTTPQWLVESGTDLQQNGHRNLAAGPGGDAIVRVYAGVERVSTAGTVWTHEIEAPEQAFHIAAFPDGKVVAGGVRSEDIGEWEALLALVGADGERLNTRAEGPLETVGDLAVTPAGDVFAIVGLSADNRLIRHDPTLARGWAVELSPDAFELAVDGVGNSYVVSPVNIEDGVNGTGWVIRVDSFDPGGAPRWIVDDLFVPLPPDAGEVNISVGDQVYVLADHGNGHALRAISTSGEVAWDLERNFGDTGDYWRALVASPCGGVHVGGHGDEQVIDGFPSLAHIDVDGVVGPVTSISEPALSGNYKRSAVTELAVSSDGHLVVAGELRPVDGEGWTSSWLRSY
jgi:hypothetical protein